MAKGSFATVGDSRLRRHRKSCALVFSAVRDSQEQGTTTAKERRAALELAEFLAHYDCSESSDTDDALDEPSRALLASFTDSYWRMYPVSLRPCQSPHHGASGAHPHH